MQLWLALIPMTGWGVTGILAARISRAIGYMKAGLIIHGAALIVSLAAWPWLFVRPERVDWWGAAMVGVVGGISYMWFCRALTYGRVGVIVPITATYSLVAAILGMLFLHESAGIMKLISIPLIVGGVVLLSLNSGRSGTDKDKKQPTGAIPAIAVALAWGVYVFGSGMVTRNTGWYLASILIRIFTLITLAVIYLGKRTATIHPRIFPGKDVAAMTVAETGANMAHNLAISLYEISYVSVVASASPLISVALSRLWLKEPVSVRQMVGVLITLGGLILLQI